MNRNLIAGIAFIVFEGGMMALSNAAKKHARVKAEFKAVNARTEEEAKAMNEALDRVDIFKEMCEREKKEAVAQLKTWKVSKEFETKKNVILAEVDDGITEFKAQIGYFDKLDELKDDFDAGIESFKKSIDFDSAKDKLKETIEEAESHFEKQKEAFNAAGDDISETTMKLRHAAEEAMEKKVREAKDKITELDKKLETETDRLTKIKTDKTRSLEEKVSKEKIRLEKKQEKDLEKLNQELDNAKNSIQAKIQKMRSPSENTSVQKHEDDMRLILDQNDHDSKVANDIFESRPREEQIAEYLVDKNVPQWAAAVIGSLPVIPVEYLVYRYICFLRRMIRRMSE